MFNKEVCKKCYIEARKKDSIYMRLVKDDESLWCFGMTPALTGKEWWDMKKVPCRHRGEDWKERPSIHDDVPPMCPYQFEHAVASGMTDVE